MPSLLHEVIVDLFRRSPQLLRELLRDRIEALAIVGVQIDSDDPNLSQLVEIDSDLVLCVRAPDGTLLCAIVIEVQLAKHEDKPRAWHAYQAGNHRRLGCPVFVVVVAIDAEVAAWACGPFGTGQTVFAPIVIGPQRLPKITEATVACANVELTLLSGLAHRHAPDVERIGEALWQALDQRGNDDDADLYWDLFLHQIGEAARRSLTMRFQHYEPLSDWGKRHYAEGEARGRRAGEEHGRRVGEEHGRRVGEEHGRRVGEEHGRRVGEEHGRIEGEAQALLVLLEARGLELDAAQRARVAACRDAEQLLGWLRRAATATRSDDVFE